MMPQRFPPLEGAKGESSNKKYLFRECKCTSAMIEIVIPLSPYRQLILKRDRLIRYRFFSFQNRNQ